MLFRASKTTAQQSARATHEKALAPPPAATADPEALVPVGAADPAEGGTVVHLHGKAHSPVSGSGESRHIATYAGVPKFIRLLSAGDRPVVALTSEEKAHVAIIELSGHSAAVIHSDVDQAVLESIIGRLRGRGYAVRADTGTAEVIRQIYVAGAGSDTHAVAADANNEYAAAAHDWILYAVKHRATDIHIETHGSQGQVRFRIDNKLEVMRTASKGQFPAAFVQKVMSYMFDHMHEAKSNSGSQFSHEENRYCMIPYSGVHGHVLKLRFQSLKGVYGPKTVLRVLDVSDDKPTKSFAELGFAESHVRLWEEAMDTPRGILIVAGETGGGKTTSIKSFIELNPHAPSLCIYALEDPSEYKLKGVHQVYLQRDMADFEASKKGFSEQTTGFVRADPDIIILNEIRDWFSANAAQQYAETGHMAVTSVHAHLLSGIVPRLINSEIGMTRSILAAPNILNLLIYQDVVAKVCPHCALTTDKVQKDNRAETVIRGLRQLNYDVSPLRWQNPSGCEHCDNRGTVGLTAVAEMFSPNEEWLRAIREGQDAEAVEIYCRGSDNDLMSPNMDGKTTFEHVLHKALNGIVDPRASFKYGNWGRYVARQEPVRKQRGE